MGAKKIGFFLTLIGRLLIIAAFCIVGYNVWDELRVRDYTLTVTKSIESNIAEKEENAADNVPAYVLNPEMEMPQKEIDGQMYIGILEIPSRNLVLPVISSWSYPALKRSPCRYAGSVYLNDMIISAHNYNSHFACLKELQIGDEILFTDMDGNVFRYWMAERDILMPTAIEEMKNGEWDLALFTCTPGGKYRVTVRCEKLEE